MHITFDVSKFGTDARSLTNALYYLKGSGNQFDSTNPEILEITCRTPSAAFRYAKLVVPYGLPEKTERVFLKNPNIAIKYLLHLRKKEFSNPDTQKRFWRKVTKNCFIAYQWASAFRTRLSEEEEEVFLDNMRLAKDYAYHVIKGRYPEKIHNILVLKSFELKDGWQKKCLQEYISYASSK